MHSISLPTKFFIALRRLNEMLEIGLHRGIDAGKDEHAICDDEQRLMRPASNHSRIEIGHGELHDLHASLNHLHQSWKLTGGIGQLGVISLLGDSFDLTIQFVDSSSELIIFRQRKSND